MPVLPLYAPPNPKSVDDLPNNSEPATGPYLTNCYPAPAGDRLQIRVRPTVPQTATFGGASRPFGVDAHYWVGAGTYVFAGNDQGSGTITTDIATSAATVTISSGKQVFLSDGDFSGTPTLTIVDNLNNAWSYQAGGAATSISLPAGRTWVGGMAHMDGYAFLMDAAGRIYNCDLNTLATWGTSNYLTAQSVPDGGVGVFRWRDYIVGFGTTSCELFYNAGNASGSPLSAVQNGATAVGIASAKQVAIAGDVMVFVGQSVNGRGLYMMGQGGPQLISPPELTPFLKATNSTGNATQGPLSVFKMPNGHTVVYQLLAGAANGSLAWCYTIETKAVWFWKATSQAGYQQPVRIINAPNVTASEIAAYAVLSTSDDGSQRARYSLFDYGGTGETMTCTIVTDNLNTGTTARKFHSGLRLSSNFSTAVSLSFTDNDYTSFSTAVSSTSHHWRRLGASRQRAYKMSWDSAVTTDIIDGAELMMTKGAN